MASSPVYSDWNSPNDEMHITITDTAKQVKVENDAGRVSYHPYATLLFEAREDNTISCLGLEGEMTVSFWRTSLAPTDITTVPAYPGGSPTAQELAAHIATFSDG